MKSKAGRPSKKTPDRVSILLDALENFMPFDKACDYAQVHRSKVYEWLQKDPELATRVRYAKSKAEIQVVKTVVEKDPKFWLKNMDPHNFKDEVHVQERRTHVIEIDSGDGGSTEFDGFKESPPQITS